MLALSSISRVLILVKPEGFSLKSTAIALI